MGKEREIGGKRRPLPKEEKRPDNGQVGQFMTMGGSWSGKREKEPLLE